MYLTGLTIVSNSVKPELVSSKALSYSGMRTLNFWFYLSSVSLR